MSPVKAKLAVGVSGVCRVDDIPLAIGPCERKLDACQRQVDRGTVHPVAVHILEFEAVDGTGHRVAEHQRRAYQNLQTVGHRAEASPGLGTLLVLRQN